jgi:lipid II:glycine glycyltransferase (peptidoglycan interpeptide bridge formation enzyme)
VITANELTLRKVSGSEADAVATLFSNLSWRQAPSYSRAAGRDMGAETDFLVFEDEGKPVGFASLRIKRAPIGNWGITYVSQGPAFSSSDQTDLVRFEKVLDLLVKEVVHTRRLSLRVQPPLLLGVPEKEISALFASRGFNTLEKKPYRTVVLDIAGDEPQIRSGFAGKWRRDLTRAERSGLRIESSSTSEAFDRFQPILDQLADRKGFVSRPSVPMLREVASAAGAADHLRVHLALKDDEVIAGHIGSYTGNVAVYLLGAANEVGRNLRASYLLQWAAICYAKSRNQIWYDLGGVDEVENPDVYRFKKRMGGQEVEFCSGYELAPSWVAQAAMKFGERAYDLVQAVKGR